MTNYINILESKEKINKIYLTERYNNLFARRYRTLVAKKMHINAIQNTLKKMLKEQIEREIKLQYKGSSIKIDNIEISFSDDMSYIKISSNQKKTNYSKHTKKWFEEQIKARD